MVDLTKVPIQLFVYIGTYNKLRILSNHAGYYGKIEPIKNKYRCSYKSHGPV